MARKHRGYFGKNKLGEEIEHRSSWFAKSVSKRRDKGKAAKKARKKNR